MLRVAFRRHADDVVASSAFYHKTGNRDPGRPIIDNIRANTLTLWCGARQLQGNNHHVNRNPESISFRTIGNQRQALKIVSAPSRDREAARSGSYPMTCLGHSDCASYQPIPLRLSRYPDCFLRADKLGSQEGHDLVISSLQFA